MWSSLGHHHMTRVSPGARPLEDLANPVCLQFSDITIRRILSRSLLPLGDHTQNRTIEPSLEALLFGEDRCPLFFTVNLRWVDSSFLWQEMTCLVMCHSWFSVCDLEAFVMVPSSRVQWCYRGAGLSFPQTSFQAMMPMR